jgi:hypothetical protein
MPKGAIHEDGNPVLSENEIRSAGKVAGLRFNHQSGTRQQPSHSALRTGILSTDSGHDPGTGRRIHDVAPMVTFATHGANTQLLVFSFRPEVASSNKT